MSRINQDDFSNLSLIELFRIEVETQSKLLTAGLLDLERHPEAGPEIAGLMRAAHSLKGAARIVGRKSAVRVAHAMEECFVAARDEKLAVSSKIIDTLLAGTDLIARIAKAPEEGFDSWEAASRSEIDAFVDSLAALADAVARAPALPPKEVSAAPAPQESAPRTPERSVIETPSVVSDRFLRVTAENLNHLMGLAGEGIVASRWVQKFGTDLSMLKRLQSRLRDRVEEIRHSSPANADKQWSTLRQEIAECQQALADRLLSLDQFDRRFLNFSTRLYHEVLDCRMRPFAEAVQGLDRMVRDVARLLGKQVRLDITGEATLVDRDILERVKAPLDHILRNSIDHGIESSPVRKARGKPAEGTLRVQATHSAGLLLIVVEDDGGGIDLESVRQAIVARQLTTLETAVVMSDAELLEFLFLPGFTLRPVASEISGRGVGMDVVQAMAKEVGGRVRIFSQPACGTRIQLELPLTLSVVRTLLAEIGGEPYAFPLARLDQALKIPRDRIELIQGRQHFALDKHHVGLVDAHQVLELDQPATAPQDVSVIVLGDASSRYGLVVDRFLGESDLVIRALDPRLGKIRNVSSAALMPDGSPVLVIDVDDLLRSIENLASGKQLQQLEFQTEGAILARKKRILVVDDSLTVREIERKLLDTRGYAVDVAIDGMDGWNALRMNQYDLVVTDVDMPRLDGIELLKLIRRDSRLKSLPVAIVSYKDREEDRNRGMEAGADYYLTKASFHDETLLRVVGDLIGSPSA
jgi:two-component system sensor histidine kinase and response regulator WspE